MRYSFVTFTGVNRKGNVMLARLHFAIGVVNLFAPFLTKYQSESTSIRLLFEELARVLQLLLQRFVKLDVRKDNSAAQLLSVQRDDHSTQYGSYALNSIKTEVKVKVAHTRSHARTVVRECCKGDDESQWERGKFDPPPPKNPLTDGHQNLCR